MRFSPLIAAWLLLAATPGMAQVEDPPQDRFQLDAAEGLDIDFEEMRDNAYYHFRFRPYLVGEPPDLVVVVEGGDVEADVRAAQPLRGADDIAEGHPRLAALDQDQRVVAHMNVRTRIG